MRMAIEGHPHILIWFRNKDSGQVWYTRVLAEELATLEPEQLNFVRSVLGDLNDTRASAQSRLEN